MRLTVLLIFLSCISLLFAQDDKSKNPNVELPDFVITGKDYVRIKEAQKIKPDLISTISEDFIKPEFSPEELELKEPSSPIEKEITLFDGINFINGKLTAGAGLYSLPTAELIYNKQYDNFLFGGTISGLNQRAYEDFSDRYSISGGVDLQYLLDKNSPVFPSSRLNLNADYGLTSYKLFASNNPEFKRDLHKGNVSFQFKNVSSSSFYISTGVNDNYTMLQDENFTENLFSANLTSILQLTFFNAGITVHYLNQSLESNPSATAVSSLKAQNSFLKLRSTLGLDLSKILRARFGATFSRTPEESTIGLYASLALMLDKNLTLFGEYSPEADFSTAGHFLRENEYLNTQSIINHYQEKDFKLKAFVKYEYDIYFQVDGGAVYYSSPAIPFYSTSSTSGMFDVNTTDGNSLSTFVDFLFHPGPYGMFYGTIQMNLVKDSVGKFIPYNPVLTSTLSYEYKFDIGLVTQANLYYAGESYADISNKTKVDAFIDLGLKFNYMLESKFNLFLQMSNLINHKNYKWLNYRETPLDVVLGFEYTW